MPRGHLIIEKDSKIARQTWPRGEAETQWLRISSSGPAELPAARRATFEWIDEFNPAASQDRQIVILFDTVEIDRWSLLAKLDTEELADWCTWLHFGGNIELETIASMWKDHWRKRSLTPAQWKRLESSMGFPLPIGDSVEADWSLPWRNFKRLANNGASFGTLWSTLERSRSTIEQEYAGRVGPPTDQVVAASCARLRASDLTPIRLHETACHVLRLEVSTPAGSPAAWQSVFAICRRISPLAESDEIRMLADELARALEALQKVSET